MIFALDESHALPVFRAWAIRLDSANRIQRLNLDMPVSMTLSAVAASIKAACASLDEREIRIRNYHVATYLREIEDAFGLDAQQRLNIAEVLS